MRKQNQGTVLLTLGTAFWGITFLFIRNALSYSDVHVFLFYRFFVAGLVLTVVFPKAILKIRGGLLFKGMLLGSVLWFSYYAQTVGLKYIEATRSAFITAISVVLVPLLVHLFSKTKLHWGEVGVGLLALAGVWFITGHGGYNHWRGDISTLAGAFGFALYVVLVGKYTGGSDSIALTIVQIFLVALVSLSSAVVQGSGLMIRSAEFWQAVLFTALFATAYMYAVQVHFQKYIPEIRVAIIFTLEPVFAGLAALLIVGEYLSLHFYMGALFIFVAMLTAELSFKKK